VLEEMRWAASSLDDWRNIAITLIFRLLTDGPGGTRIESSRNLSEMAWFRHLARDGGQSQKLFCDSVGSAEAGLEACDSVLPSLSFCRGSPCTANSAHPQFTQIVTGWKAHTVGVSRFTRPGKWMFISAVNTRKSGDSHKLHIP
jgi:hypothetical protein